MPPVHFQSTLQRLWRRVYNIRLQNLDEDIIIYQDDLVSAFRSIFYHPDVASAYDFFLSPYLVIPVDMVFGSIYSPSLFFLLSNPISFASWFVHRLPISHPTTLIIDWVRFPHAPPSSRDINPAHTDPMNQGVEGTNLVPQPTCVDDTIMSEVRSLICQAAENIILTSSIFIGNGNLVKEPISIKTFECLFTHLKKNLGFISDSRSMTASYPYYKRYSLLGILHSLEWEPKSSYQVQLLAKILGNICHLSRILPFGHHLYIHLQICLSRFICTHIRCTKSLSSMKRIIRAEWNPCSSVRISYSAARDLWHLRQILHWIDVALPDQSSHLKLSPLCGSIRRLYHLHGRPMLPPSPEMEAPPISLQMSSWMASLVPGWDWLPYQHSRVHSSRYQCLNHDVLH